MLSEDGVVGAQVVLAGDAVRADTTADSGGDHDLRAGADFRHGFADPLHNPGSVRTWDVGKRQTEAREALSDPQIDVIKRSRAHPNKDIVRTERRRRHLLHTHDFGPALPRVHDSLQRAPRKGGIGDWGLGIGE